MEDNSYVNMSFPMKFFQYQDIKDSAELLSLSIEFIGPDMDIFEN